MSIIRITITTSPVISDSRAAVWAAERPSWYHYHIQGTAAKSQTQLGHTPWFYANFRSINHHVILCFFNPTPLQESNEGHIDSIAHFLIYAKCPCPLSAPNLSQPPLSTALLFIAIKASSWVFSQHACSSILSRYPFGDKVWRDNKTLLLRHSRCFRSVRKLQTHQIYFKTVITYFLVKEVVVIVLWWK